MPRGKRINPAALYFPDKIQEKLSYLKDYPLTVIHAPAGFGKSTALRRFFEQNVSKSTPVLWHTFLARQPSASWRSICALIGQTDRKCADDADFTADSWISTSLQSRPSSTIRLMDSI